MISNYDDLRGLIQSIKQIPIEDIKSVEVALEYSMIQTTIFVAETILKHETVLLPLVHEKFSAFVSETISASNLEVVGKPKHLVTARWI